MRIGLKIEYDGTAYAGWQRQKNAPSVQAAIEQALFETLHWQGTIIGAGRTDAGVHALGQVAHFDIETRVPPDRFSYILNQRFRRTSASCSPGRRQRAFSARRSAHGKHYRYTLYCSPHASALERNVSLHVPQKLDLAAMQRAAQALVGEHDFSAFRTMGSNIVGTVRTIYRLTVRQEGRHIYIDVYGNGFLYNMVRIIAGTLIAVGKGKIPPEAMGNILAAKDRTLAGATAPARGLCMCEVCYPGLGEEEKSPWESEKRKARHTAPEIIQKYTVHGFCKAPQSRAYYHSVQTHSNNKFGRNAS